MCVDETMEISRNRLALLVTGVYFIGGVLGCLLCVVWYTFRTPIVPGKPVDQVEDALTDAEAMSDDASDSVTFREVDDL